MKLNEEGLNGKFLTQLPVFKCHKVVRAGKIGFMAKDEPNGMLMVHAEPSLMPLAVPLDFLQRHAPEIGGYLVVYEDGYLSYSPADVFEAGYHRVELGCSNGGVGGEAAAAAGEPLVTDIPPHQLRVLEELAEVGTRLEKLVAFTGTELFASLDEQERDRLTRQANAMGDYASILGERIAAWQVVS